MTSVNNNQIVVDEALDKKKSLTTVEIGSQGDVQLSSKPIPEAVKEVVKIPTKDACGSCHKKLKLIETHSGKCNKCNLTYCTKHRFPEDHSCDMEKYRQQQRVRLEQSNPKVVCDKLTRI